LFCYKARIRRDSVLKACEIYVKTGYVQVLKQLTKGNLSWIINS